MDKSEQQLIQKEYIARINKAFDYIETHLEKQFTLQELAMVANFSKFHFHRIFQGITGETPFQFILRIRLERAASLLSGNYTVSEIADKCGFSDISIFSRNFKNYFKLSPSNYRSIKYNKSNLSQIQSNYQQNDVKPTPYFCSHTKTIKWKTRMKLNKSIEIKEIKKFSVVYLRHIGAYKGNADLFGQLWNKLFTWAAPRGLLQQNDLKTLIVYHDDPNIAAEEKLRLSACISVPSDFKPEGEFGKMEIDGGKYVVARFELGPDQFQEAWEWVYGIWFPSSGYQPDDMPCFEMYPEPPSNNRFVVDICVPVKPM